MFAPVPPPLRRQASTPPSAQSPFLPWSSSFHRPALHLPLLPDDVLFQVDSFLPTPDLFNLPTVCTALRSRADHPSYWRRVFSARYSRSSPPPFATDALFGSHQLRELRIFSAYFHLLNTVERAFLGYYDKPEQESSEEPRMQDR